MQVQHNGPRGGFRSGSTLDEAHHNDEVTLTNRPRLIAQFTLIYTAVTLGIVSRRFTDAQDLIPASNSGGKHCRLTGRNRGQTQAHMLMARWVREEEERRESHTMGLIHVSSLWQ